MDPTWLDQLLQYIKGPGLNSIQGMRGLESLATPGAQPGMPGTVPPGGAVQTPWGPGVVPNPPRTGGPGVPVGQPYSPVQLPVPAQTRSMVNPLAGLQPPQGAVPGMGQIGQAGGMGQLGGPQAGNPLGLTGPQSGPGSPGSGLTGIGGLISALLRRSPVGAAAAVMQPQPAQGGPTPPMTGTPVTPTGPLPPAQLLPQFGPPQPAPTSVGPPMPTPGAPGSPAFGPPMPPQGQAFPGLGGKGGPGAGVMPGVPYAAPGQGGKGDPMASVSPGLIQMMLKGLMGSPLAGGWNQQGMNTASGGRDQYGNVTY